jgi:predicted TPR repeat methyltransferase
MADTIIPDKESAFEYDRQAKETNWFGPEVVFGLVYEYVRPGQTLLDLGIGSGLSSIRFHQVGLEIHGLDGSADVLEVCRAKGFAADLKQRDLRDLPLPYASDFFDHVICVAVLNSFDNLGPLFSETGRIIKAPGLFAFTYEEQEPGQEDHYAINRVEVNELPDPDTAVVLYRHRRETIIRLLEENGFTLIKALEFRAFEYPAESRCIFFKAFVARKMQRSP